MLKAKSIPLIAATLAIATAAAAGPFKNEEKENVHPGANAPAASAPATNAAARGDFEYLGGDSGWSLKQHVYVLAGGRFVHSDECDHAIRSAQAPTRQQIEADRQFSPGA